MTISRGLQIIIVALAISASLATPLKRASTKKSARQIEFTTPSSVVETKTGYPEAGFRPKIPFDLPHEFQPKAVTEAATEAATEASTKAITEAAITEAATTEAATEYATESTTEAFEIFGTTTTTESTLEDFDEIVPTTTAATTEVLDHTPADTYGAPDFSPIDEEEFEADVVPAPAEDFQPPREEDSKDFSADFDVIDNADSEFIADIPAVEQTKQTEGEELEVMVNQVPAEVYGAPDMDNNEPKTDVETVEQELIEVVEPEQFDVEPQVEEQEGSAESELELVDDNEPRIQEPAEIYGAPGNADESERDNELESELADVEEQIEILSRLTKLRSGRLVFLPVQKNLYLGRLVSNKSAKRSQRKNGRLLRL